MEEREGGMDGITPEDLTIGALTERACADEVREGMSVRESELAEGAGIDGRLGAKPEDFR